MRVSPSSVSSTKARAVTSRRQPGSLPTARNCTLSSLSRVHSGWRTPSISSSAALPLVHSSVRSSSTATRFTPEATGSGRKAQLRPSTARLAPSPSWRSVATRAPQR